MKKISKEEFVKAAINAGNGGVQNDTDNIWWDVEGTNIQANTKISKVFGDRKEEEPFEFSYEVEADEDHIAWDYLYDDYCEKFDSLYTD